MTRDKALSLIASGVFEPGVLGSMAHRILDYVVMPNGMIGVRTPRLGWHLATQRELKLLRRA